MAKVFERIVYDQFCIYLTAHNLISSKQSGFWSLHSTVTALLETVDSWTCSFNIDKGNVNGVVFLDLKRAFDMINHSILLSKWYSYGVRNSSYSWFKSYLNLCKQKCTVNGSLSGDQYLTCGIPQGTILGPLLFTLYINDLPNCLTNVQYRMYADDRHLTFASINEAHLERALNEDVAKVNEWLIAYNLTLNKSKTEFMLIRSRHWRLQTFNTPPSLFIDNAPIHQVVSTKSLGVDVDESLSWNVHVDNITKKIASGIGISRRSRPFVTFEVLSPIYSTLVQPYFDYCN